MRFYQELQLNQSGSKELIRQSKTTKEKLYHIAVYLFKNCDHSGILLSLCNII